MAQDEHIGSPFAGPERDGNDWARLRHARDRHLGFPVGRYLQPPPMLFTRDGHNIFLGDMYRGHTAFLLCAGPSLKTHDLSQLQQRGILTYAVNNAATVFRPQLWTCVDDPGNFCDAIWYDPGILKLVPLCHMEKTFLVRDEQDQLVPSTHRVGDMPAVFGYRRNEAFVPQQWLHEDTFNWGNHSDRTDACGQKGSRSVMYVALRMLFYLGVRRVYLLGCDFRMEYGKANYAFEQDRSRASVRNNNSSYRILNIRLGHLKPYFDREGFQVFNCTPDSGLVVFPHVPYAEAVASALSIMPARVHTAGMYDFKQRQQDAQADPAPVLSDGPPQAGASPGQQPLRLPPVTLVTWLDEIGVMKLKEAWATWMRLRPWLLNVPVLVLHDRRLKPASLAWLGDPPQVRYIPWEMANNTDRFQALVTVPAQHVQTPWFLRLDPNTVALDNQYGLRPEWFAPDASGRLPAFIGHAWGYTKPKDAMAQLDAWGNTIPGLQEHPPLNLPCDPAAELVRHPTIRSWCFLGNTAWVKQMAAYLSARPPCESDSVYFSYCAARRRDYLVRVNMKQFGWEPIPRLRALRIRCQELLRQNVPCLQATK